MIDVFNVELSKMVLLVVVGGSLGGGGGPPHSFHMSISICFLGVHYIITSFKEITFFLGPYCFIYFASFILFTVLLHFKSCDINVLVYFLINSGSQ